MITAASTSPPATGPAHRGAPATSVGSATEMNCTSPIYKIAFAICGRGSIGSAHQASLDRLLFGTGEQEPWLPLADYGPSPYEGITTAHIRLWAKPDSDPLGDLKRISERLSMEQDVQIHTPHTSGRAYDITTEEEAERIKFYVRHNAHTHVSIEDVRKRTR